MAFFSDLFGGVTSSVVTGAKNSITNIAESGKEKVADLFKDVTTGAAAVIKGEGVKAVPATPAPIGAVPAQPLPPVAASGASQLPSYAMPLAIIALALLILGRSK